MRHELAVNKEFVILEDQPTLSKNRWPADYFEAPLSRLSKPRGSPSVHNSAVDRDRPPARVEEGFVVALDPMNGPVDLHLPCPTHRNLLTNLRILACLGVLVR